MKRQLERRFVSIPQFNEAGVVETDLEERDDSSADSLPRIVGYSAVFGVDTEINTFFGSFKERIQKGAFRRAIRERQDVRALRNHDSDNLLGRISAGTLSLKEDDTGLRISVQTPDTTVGRDTVESIRRGDLSGMSFAFIVRKEKWINGEDGDPDMRIIQDVDLFDVGPVTFPAYEQTTADVEGNSEIHKIGLEELGKEIPAEARSVNATERHKIVFDASRTDDNINVVLNTISKPTKEENQRWGGIEVHWKNEADRVKVPKPKFKELLEKLPEADDEQIEKCLEVFSLNNPAEVDEARTVSLAALRARREKNKRTKKED